MITAQNVYYQLRLTTSSTSQIDYFLAYYDRGITGDLVERSTWGEITTATTTQLTNNITDLLSTGVANISRIASYASFVNVGGSSNTVCLYICNTNTSADCKLSPSISLASGDALIYSADKWYVFDSRGTIKNSDSSTKKSLGQSAPSATTETDLYTVPASTTTEMTSMVITNRSTAATFRVSHSVGGGATATKDYLFYDAAIAANEVITLDNLGFASATDKIRVYASTANLSFNIYGKEYS